MDEIDDERIQYALKHWYIKSLRPIEVLHVLRHIKVHGSYRVILPKKSGFVSNGGKPPTWEDTRIYTITITESDLDEHIQII